MEHGTIFEARFLAANCYRTVILASYDIFTTVLQYHYIAQYYTIFLFHLHLYPIIARENALSSVHFNYILNQK